MLDPIAPASASSPAELVALVSLAVSDGDLDAALAQYEPGAAFDPWAPAAPAKAQGLARSLAQLMALRLPLSVTVCGVLASGEAMATAELATGAELAAAELATAELVTGAEPVSGGGAACCPLALVLADRRIAGTGPDCQPVDLRGFGATVARRQPDGSWRIAADAWRLDAAAEPPPPG